MHRGGPATAAAGTPQAEAQAGHQHGAAAHCGRGEGERALEVRSMEQC